MNRITNSVLDDVREIHTSVDDGLSDFVSVRGRLFGVAYRILGSATEAEDIVQDVWLRWQATNRNAVQVPAAFLATTTTRLAINLAQSARLRHETCMAPSLPEPAEMSADPGIKAERGEALKFALLLLFEKLSRKERAAYVLRKAFDYSYRQIADILNLSSVNTRQLVTRAGKHITEGRRVPVNPAERERLLVAFTDAAQRGDFAALERVLV